jgi:hypothetical protein
MIVINKYGVVESLLVQQKLNPRYARKRRVVREGHTYSSRYGIEKPFFDSPRYALLTVRVRHKYANLDTILCLAADDINGVRVILGEKKASVRI